MRPNSAHLAQESSEQIAVPFVEVRVGLLVERLHDADHVAELRFLVGLFPPGRELLEVDLPAAVVVHFEHRLLELPLREPLPQPLPEVHELLHVEGAAAVVVDLLEHLRYNSQG
jgi:hypothetical protein